MKLTFPKSLVLLSMISLSFVTPTATFAIEPDMVHLETSNSTTGTVTIYMNPEVTINAAYLHLSYDAKKYVCTAMRINEEEFPLILESHIDTAGDVILAIAQPGYGTTATTTLATLTCSNDLVFTLQNDSKAYLADGEGTEINILALTSK